MARSSSPRYDLLPQNSPDVKDSTYEFMDKSFSPWRLASKLLRAFRRICKPTYIFLFFILFLCWQIILNASYTNPPKFSIPSDEKVFIAANIVDAKLIDGLWGDNLVALVDAIGKERVFVSVYGGPKNSLVRLEGRLHGVQKKIVAEVDDAIDLSALHRITLPSGQTRIKRIEYLADVRNKALDPITSGEMTEKYDRVLFLNDVLFEVEGAMRLLWGTNINEEGRAEYKAVCGTDFISSWKFYDTYATRDTEGYSIGVTIFPWFGGKGESTSRNDVLAGKDAVRVKSCWGGIVAFDARFFQTKIANTTSSISKEREPEDSDHIYERSTSPTELPLKFRSEPESFWDSSECCLIHADILATPDFPDFTTNTNENWGEGIFMNPFVRVAYDARSFNNIKYAKRFERLFVPWQAMINYLAHLPRFNDRRGEQGGDIVEDRLWIPNSFTTEQEQAAIDLQKDFGGKYGNAPKSADIKKQEKRDLGDEDSTWQGLDSLQASSASSYFSAIVGGLKSRSESSPPSRIMHAKREMTPSEWAMAKPKEYWGKEGHYVDYQRVARKGGYCGVRQLTVLREGVIGVGEKGWENLRGEVPPREEGR
ncbi:glycosyltransferase family 69 protein [Sclerotinia borealis F-4128]|uniref:Glycosyltransferase family 69 protein n=1 Tax=Sclerotinia borealis (strain F-4128) TaxID=1432307 RepID=W9CCT6_SCLBF|nr:glycosyltransferase family 69 protein [Sclerotinia borealis F-4128]